MIEARLYTKLADNKVKCHLCAHRCTIADGKRGICQVRENRKGTLYSLVYGLSISQAIDPVEKKPLFHFYPGSSAFSFATVGCNFRCSFCQNWQISQAARAEGMVDGHEATPEHLAAAARHYGCRSIAYTYTEPTIFFEYAYDTAVIASRSGIKSIYVTNGYMTEEMLDAFGPYLHAANVDLKSFRDEFYVKTCGARLQPVLDTLKAMKKRGIWLEVTTLVVPGQNDSEGELRGLAEFLAKEVGVETPWHISRFHPEYEMMDAQATPPETLDRAKEIGLEAGLRYVYEGNVPGSNGENTYCYSCHRRLIHRFGFSIVENLVGRDSCCPYCGAAIDGVGLARP
ncbi:MAG TPA: AmmeMemoRadiSam system radical SAM enzyme [Anaerolineae bacterium]|nr:AmmeMemoRadiSam system radical SAM enzyme [Anaerolineae bacterium]HQJ50334.1 AmmeMemoRadiSam system radical SAM enzyme [Anaerolineae bacterium]